jgi:hypothetical protein
MTEDELNTEKIDTTPLADDAFTEVDLDEDQIKERRSWLIDAQIQKDSNDIQEAQMNRTLDLKLPLLQLEDDIAAIEKEMAEGIVRKFRKDGSMEVKPATEYDKLNQQVQLDAWKKMKELDLPMREFRLQMADFVKGRQRPDTKENQIKKLEKEIRNKKAVVLKSRIKNIPPMVGG